MSYFKIFAITLIGMSFSLQAQVQDPVKNEKKVNTSSAKAVKPNQSTDAKPLKVSKTTQNSGKRVEKSNQSK